MKYPVLACLGVEFLDRGRDHNRVDCQYRQCRFGKILKNLYEIVI